MLLYGFPGTGKTATVYEVAQKSKRDVDLFTGENLAGSETILIVDDEELIRDLACEILNPYGYRAIPAKDGQEAVSIYESSSPKIDLVLMDIIMPVMDGIKAAERIRELDANARILICSGYNSNFVSQDISTDKVRRSIRQIW